MFSKARFPGGKLTISNPRRMLRAESAALHSGACERASVRALMVHVSVLAASASQSLESWNSMHLSRLLFTRAIYPGTQASNSLATVGDWVDLSGNRQ
jgi:hypothetical protein